MSSHRNERVLLPKREFSKRVNTYIKTMSFSRKNTRIAGSFQYKQMKYFSDIDLYEVVEVDSVQDAVKKFKRIIRNIDRNQDMVITDIKLGYEHNWDIFAEDEDYEEYTKGFYKSTTLNYARLLYEKNIITKDELKEAENLLKTITKENFDSIKHELRFGVIRWSKKEVLKGWKKLRDGSKLKIEDAIASDDLFKLDTIVYLDGLYVEMSIIYDLRFRKTKKRVNGFKVNPIETLVKDIDMYMEKKEYMKVIKRMMSIAMRCYSLYPEYRKRSRRMINELLDIINSDVGNLNQVLNNIKAIKLLIETKRDRQEYHDILDSMIDRLATVDLNSFIEHEHDVAEQINKITGERQISLKDLDQLIDELSDIVNKEAYKYIEGKL